jgi:hypothetical protein
MNESLSFNIPGGKEHLMLARHDGIVWREGGEARPGRRHVVSLSIDYDSLVWTFLQSLHWLLRRLCSQMPDPPHCLHLLLIRLCSQMLAPQHCWHPLLWRLCSQMSDPTHPAPAFFPSVSKIQFFRFQIRTTLPKFHSFCMLYVTRYPKFHI